MKTKLSVYGSTLLMLLSALFIPATQAVFAATVSSSVTGSGGVSATVYGSDYNDTNATSTSAQPPVNVNVSVGTNASGVTVTAGNTATTTDNATVTANGTQNVAVSSLLDPSTVSTSADLTTFTKASMSTDKDINGMTFSDNSVKVSYIENGAKFLGIIPARIIVNGTVNADGTATVSYPWYRFLLSVKDDSDLKSSLATSASENASTNSAWSASAQANLAAQIYADIRDHATANTSSNTSATADTSGSY